jgi:hypothetical protein
MPSLPIYQDLFLHGLGVGFIVLLGTLMFLLEAGRRGLFKGAADEELLKLMKELHQEILSEDSPSEEEDDEELEEQDRKKLYRDVLVLTQKVKVSQLEMRGLVQALNQKLDLLLDAKGIPHA